MPPNNMKQPTNHSKIGKWSIPIIFAAVLSLAGFIAIVFFSWHPAFNDLSFNVSTKLASEFGSFIGGLVGPILALASVLLIFETLNRQHEISRRQQFEIRFFELIKIHRENVQEMAHKVPREQDKYVTGRRVFLEIRDQFGKIYEIVKKESGDIFKEQEQIDISYKILFIGVGKNSLEILNNTLEKYSAKKELIEKIITKCREKKSADKKFVMFGGHMSRLGHYFRHLFQTVNYIHSANFLTPIEKYDYVKTLRAQLSTEELVIFFFNALSQFGEKWEMAVTDKKDKLITEYRFIKNIPLGFTFGIPPQKYFNFKYEYEE